MAPVQPVNYPHTRHTMSLESLSLHRQWHAECTVVITANNAREACPFPYLKAEHQIQILQKINNCEKMENKYFWSPAKLGESEIFVLATPT